jgi:hypothetical protein
MGYHGLGLSLLWFNHRVPFTLQVSRLKWLLPCGSRNRILSGLSSEWFYKKSNPTPLDKPTNMKSRTTKTFLHHSSPAFCLLPFAFCLLPFAFPYNEQPVWLATSANSTTFPLESVIHPWASIKGWGSVGSVSARAVCCGNRKSSRSGLELSGS